jgi:hypothetical protein
MPCAQHQAAMVWGWELAPESVHPAGLPTLSGQDETLGSKGSQVKSRRSRAGFALARFNVPSRSDGL